MRNIFIFLSVILVAGCLNGQGQAPSGHRDNTDKGAVPEDRVATISFSGGHFWFLQEAFHDVYGVVEVTAGYTGGDTMNPRADHYAEEGHQEAVSVSYQTSRIAFVDLLDVYFKAIDPTDGEGQFLERGKQFRPVIYWTEESQRLDSLQYLRELEQSGMHEKPIVLELKKAEAFYRAADQEQQLSLRNPDVYQRYYEESGREARHREKIYRKPDQEELKKSLSSLQYRVSQEDATERAFDNAYWNNHEEGIYVDIASGEPLFSSKDKFESGTGWPSFTIPLVPGNVLSVSDHSFGMVRTEVRSRYGDSHLGHLFPDGPHPTGLRYCINSASLRFIPVKDLEDEGYGEYLKYFKE